MLAPLGFVVANLLVMWSTWDTVWKLGVAIVIGYVLLGATIVFGWNEVKPRWHVRSSAWIPVYLVGMGVIVFQRVATKDRLAAPTQLLQRPQAVPLGLQEQDCLDFRAVD